MERVFRNIRLSGEFEGKRDAAIEFKFLFCDADDTYFYKAERPGLWEIAHRGKFYLKKGPRLGSHPSTVVRLEPCKPDIEVGAALAYKDLAERALPGRKPEEYFLSVYQYDHGLNPDIKLRVYSFWVPDKTGTLGTDWTLEPVI